MQYVGILDRVGVRAGSDGIEFLPPQGRRIRLIFNGAAHGNVKALEPLPGRFNYLLGSHSRDWRLRVPHFAEISWPRLYPGIRGWLRLRQKNRSGALLPPEKMEIGFDLAAGSRLKWLHWMFQGASAQLLSTGELQLVLPQGEIRLRRPRMYELWRGRRRRLRGGYRRLRQGWGFWVHHWRHGRLLIDPTLAYSSFLGGSGQDAATAIALDASGNVYLTGFTSSADFPLLNPLENNCTPCTSTTPTAFIAKFSPGAGSLIFATFLGGSGATMPSALALDPNADIYIAGWTTAPDLPMVQPLSAHCDQCYGQSGDGFVAELNAAGSALVSSTYFGGSGDDHIAALALDDASGNVWLAGWTLSSDLVTLNPLQAACASCTAGLSDAFVAELAPGNKLLFSTYLGGSGNDQAHALALGPQGDIYVAGWTLSPDFPLMAALQGACASCGETSPQADGFLVHLAPGGGQLDASTYFGGSGWDQADAIAINPVNGNIFVAGKTLSTDFPLYNALQASCPACQTGSGSNAWLAEFDNSLSSLQFSTYLGGSLGDAATALVVDAQGEPLVAGVAFSADFPLVQPLQTQLNQGQGSGSDAFLAKANASLTAWIFSSFLGGNADDSAAALALDAQNNAWLAGVTNSTNFPAENALQSGCKGCPGAGDAWLAEVAGLSIPLAQFTPASLDFGSQGENTTSPAQTLILTNVGDAPLAISAIDTPGGIDDSDYSQTNYCPPSLAPLENCAIHVSFTPDDLGTQSGTIVVSDNLGSQTVMLTGVGVNAPNVVFNPNSRNFEGVTVGSNEAQTAQLYNNGLAALAIGQVTMNGPFTQTNNCPASLSAGAMCTFTVTFAPTSAGAITGELSLTDNAPGSPQVLNLSGTGEDFTLGAAANASTSASITAGQTAQYQLTLNSLGGYSGQINLSCTGAPNLANCSVSPASANLAANESAALAISITTTAGSRLPPWSGPPRGNRPWLPLLALAGALVFILVRGKTARQPLRLTLALGLALFTAACGSGGNSPGSSPAPQPGTPAGTYTLTIQASAGSLTHSQKLTLIVQ